MTDVHDEDWQWAGSFSFRVRAAVASTDGGRNDPRWAVVDLATTHNVLATGTAAIYELLLAPAGW